MIAYEVVLTKLKGRGGQPVVLKVVTWFSSREEAQTKADELNCKPVDGKLYTVRVMSDYTAEPGPLA